MADTPARDDRPPTILESALRYDRAPAMVLLIVLPLVSWMWIVVMARDMYGPMTELGDCGVRGEFSTWPCLSLSFFIWA